MSSIANDHYYEEVKKNNSFFQQNKTQQSFTYMKSSWTLEVFHRQQTPNETAYPRGYLIKIYYKNIERDCSGEKLHLPE